MASDEIEDQHDSEDCSHSELKDGSAVKYERRLIMTEINFRSVEINCKQSPLKGQGSRCSRNFSLKGFQERNNKGSKKVKFTIMKNGEPADDITINVAKDRSGRDKGIYSKICNVEDKSKGTRNTFDLSTESPLYFCDPKPRSEDSLIVVIEGTN